MNFKKIIQKLMSFFKPKKVSPVTKAVTVPNKASTGGVSSIDQEELSRLIENKKQFDQQRLKKLPQIQEQARQDALSLRESFRSIEEYVEKHGIVSNVSGSSFSIKG